MAQYQGVMNASKFILYAGSSYATSTPIGFATDVTISVSAETRDVTNKFSGGWRYLAEGLRSYTISGSHLFAENASNGEKELYDAIGARTPLYFKATVQNDNTGSTAEVNGNTRYRGVAYITSLERTGGVDDNVTFSFTAEGTGVLIRETISE